MIRGSNEFSSDVDLKYLAKAIHNLAKAGCQHLRTNPKIRWWQNMVRVAPKNSD